MRAALGVGSRIIWIGALSAQVRRREGRIEAIYRTDGGSLATQSKFKVEVLPPAVRAEVDQWPIDRDFHYSYKLAAELLARFRRW